MRPKKTVLCVCGDEQRLSRRKFLLNVWGYRVVSADNLAGMWELLREGHELDLLLIEPPLLLLGLGDTTLGEVRRLQPEMRTLVIFAKAVPANDMCADAVLGHANSSAAEVRDRIKILVARKRGPKKVSRAVEPETELVAA